MYIEKLVRKAEGQGRQENMLIDDEISAMNSNIHLLRGLRQNMNKENVSHLEIINNQEIVRGVIENINENLWDEMALWHLVVTMNRSSAGEFLGTISRDEIIISMPDPQKRMEEKLIHKTVTNTFQLKCIDTFFMRKHVLKFVCLTN